MKEFIYKLLMFFLSRDFYLFKSYSGKGERVIGFFCSTIGELNACKVFIDKKYLDNKIVIFTDRDCYEESFLKLYPDSDVFFYGGNYSTLYKQVEKYFFKEFYVCEIPCLPNDAPCRLDYLSLKLIKKASDGLFMINGWLYGYSPTCRQDFIERKYFSSDYLDLFDAVGVQTDEVKYEALKYLKDESKIFVNGNMKFDSLFVDFDISKDVFDIFESLRKRRKYIFVAGCVSSLEELKWLVKSCFLEEEVCANFSLVIAPRHPENKDFISGLVDIFKEFEVDFCFRSKIYGDVESNVVVLDTFGELRDCYALSDLSYVGRDHNLLEPAAFKKPIVTLDGWNETYPSYPVFSLLSDEGYVTVVSEDDNLKKMFFDRYKAEENRVFSDMADLKGACDKTVAMVDSFR